MDNQAVEARREYFRNYAKANRAKMNEHHKKWRDKNPDKIKQYQENYWNKLAEKQNSLNS